MDIKAAGSDEHGFLVIKSRANVRMKVWAAFDTATPAKGAKKKYGFVVKELSKVYFRCCMLQ